MMNTHHTLTALSSGMSISRKVSKTAGLAMASLMALVSSTPSQAANDLNQLKLFGRWSSPALSGYGTSMDVATNEKWTIAGHNSASEQIGGQGGLQVHNSVTGAWTRKILPPGPAVLNSRFGVSVALSGDLAVVGASGVATNTGAAFIYNVSTGVLVRTLSATGGVVGDQFGSAVAFSGKRVLVSAVARDSAKGAVYLFDATTGTQLNRFDLGAGGVASDRFGSSLAVDGNVLLVGASGRDADKGAAYLYDLTTFQQLAVLQPAALAAGDRFGSSVALSGVQAVVGAPARASDKGGVFVIDRRDGTTVALTAPDGVAGDVFGAAVSADADKVIVGAPSKAGAGTQTGSVYLFDLHTKAFIRQVSPVDGVSNTNFGFHVSLCGNTAAVTSMGDDTLALDAGAAYLVRPLIVPLSKLTKAAAKGDFAPSSPDTTFNTLGDGFINSDGEVSFLSTLLGTGASGADNGLWTELKTPNTLQLSLKSKNVLVPSIVVQSIGTALSNLDTHDILLATLKPGVGGITGLSNKRIFDQSSSALVSVISSNDPMALFANAKISTFGEIVQSNQSLQNRWAVAVNLRPEAVTSTTALNDTAVIAYNTTSEGIREGSAVPSLGVDYGQFSGRLAYHYTSYQFGAATTGPASNNQVVIQKFVGSPAVVVAQKGLPAPGVAGAVFASFLGETAGPGETVLYRATISGAGVVASNNEGLWTRTVGGVHALIMRKGQALGFSGLTVAKFVKSWATAGERFLAQVQVAGPGVNAANDQAVVLIQEDASFLVLMREGDVAMGCDGAATIGVLGSVEVDPFSGNYAIISTLAGAPVGTELAMYTGDVTLGNATTLATHRRPNLFLRKGWLYDNQPGKVKSISLPATNMPASGFGGTGRSRAISWAGNLAVTVEFDNGARQIMKGLVP